MINKLLLDAFRLTISDFKIGKLRAIGRPFTISSLEDFEDDLEEAVRRLEKKAKILETIENGSELEGEMSELEKEIRDLKLKIETESKSPEIPLNSKGRVVIPKFVRDLFNLKPGDRLQFRINEEKKRNNVYIQI